MKNIKIVLLIGAYAIKVECCAMSAKSSRKKLQ